MGIRALPSGDVLFIQPEDDIDTYFLLGYLNSEFFRRYYLVKGGRRGRRISFTQRLIENVEIPLFSKEPKNKIIQTTIEILEKIKKGVNTVSIEKYIDDVILSAINKEEFDENITISACKNMASLF